MPRANFWLSVKAIAAFLDGDRRGSEQTIDLLETDLRKLDRDARKNASEELTVIIAQLSRLKMRMLDFEM